VCSNLNLSLANILDLHDIAEVSDTAVDLNLVLKELLEGGDVKDLVAGGLRSVDDELLQSAPIVLTLALSPIPQGAYIRVRGEETYLVGDLGLLALGGFLHKSMNLSLLYHAATSKRRANSKAVSFTYC